jgi:hypothetical protein
VAGREAQSGTMEHMGKIERKLDEERIKDVIGES